jgi:hypothetical protein
MTVQKVSWVVRNSLGKFRHLHIQWCILCNNEAQSPMLHALYERVPESVPICGGDALESARSHGARSQPGQEGDKKDGDLMTAVVPMIRKFLSK